MNLSFANIRTAIDVLRNRLPGSLAMLKATDASVLVEHAKSGSKVQVTYWFQDGAAASTAYRACERLYEFNRLEANRLDQ